MFNVLSKTNLLRPDTEFKEECLKITKRGYSASDGDIPLPAEFQPPLREQKINPLSVSDIADSHCPTMRDIYFTKGLNKKCRRRSNPTWGSKAGYIVEEHFKKMITNFKIKEKSYSSLAKKSDKSFESFRKRIKDMRIRKLKSLVTNDNEDPEWLFRLLKLNQRTELGYNILDKSMTECHLLRKLLRKGCDVTLKDIEINDTELEPNFLLGIGKTTPDFIIEKYGIIGDIKTGFASFNTNYLLTCAGYALAYESSRGKNYNINFGTIYYFPTRCSTLTKIISYSQIYVFLIDDNLRMKFIQKRNNAYNAITRNEIPELPSETKECYYCKYRNQCIE